MKINKQRYEAPQAEIIAIESQSVFCGSGGANPNANAGGKANNMNVNSALVW